LNVTVTVCVLDPEEITIEPLYGPVVRTPVAAVTVRTRGDPLLSVPPVGETESHPELVTTVVATMLDVRAVETCTVCVAGFAPPAVAVKVSASGLAAIVPVPPTIRVIVIDSAVCEVGALLDNGAQTWTVVE
jgi:hypothetical protein